MRNESGASRAVYIFGAGGHGKVVADIALEAGWCVKGFLDDRLSRGHSTILDLSIAGGRELIPELIRNDESVVVAVGDNTLRMRLQVDFENLGLRIETIVSPHAYVSKWATIGAGSVVMPGAVINVGASIGKGAIINSAAVVEHDCAIGDFTHLAPKCALGGGVRVGDLSQVGIGASILPMVELGARTVLGAGAIATRDLPDNVVAYGIPARVMQTLALQHANAAEVVNEQ